MVAAVILAEVVCVTFGFVVLRRRHRVHGVARVLLLARAVVYFILAAAFVLLLFAPAVAGALLALGALASAFVVVFAIVK